MRRRVVVNFVPPREPRIQPRVGAEKALVQVLFVPRDNDHEVGLVVTQRFAQRVNALLGKGVALVGVAQRVRFVNEQHAAQTLLDHVRRFNGGLS